MAAKRDVCPVTLSTDQHLLGACLVNVQDPINTEVAGSQQLAYDKKLYHSTQGW